MYYFVCIDLLVETQQDSCLSMFYIVLVLPKKYVSQLELTS